MREVLLEKLPTTGSSYTGFWKKLFSGLLEQLFQASGRYFIRLIYKALKVFCELLKTPWTRLFSLLAEFVPGS